jgi:branched-chain amino acid transport system substrate-binding protein
MSGSKERPLLKLRRTIAVLISILLLAFSAGCQNQDKSKEKIKIGAALPLTGSISFYGKPQRRVLQMGIKKINKEGGIDGREVELVVEDSKSTAKGGTNAVQSILLNDPEIVITSLTIVTNATQPILEKKGIPQVALSIHPNLARQSDYTVRPYYGLEDEMEIWAEHISNEKYKRVSTIWANSPEQKVAINKHLKPSLKEEGARLVTSTPFEIGATNVRPQMSKIESSDPDLIIAMDFGNVYERILSQARVLGLHDKMASSIGILSAPPLNSKLTDGVVFTGPEFVVRQTEKYVSFKKEFDSKYESSLSYDTIYAYDALMMCVKAMRNGGITGQQFTNSFTNMEEYEGISGKIVPKDNGNVSVDISMGVYDGSETNMLKSPDAVIDSIRAE